MRYDFYDVAILGCGPAGLSAGVNAAIRNKRVIIIGAEVCSPPLHKAQKIDNYLGLPDISGNELLDKFMQHALRKDIEIINSKAAAISEWDRRFNILVGEESILAWTIVIATGIPYRSTLPREEEFLGKGLGYCATCDGPLYRGKDVIIIGHSSEAEGEASFMAEICRQVYYVPLYKTIGNLNPNVTIVDAKPAGIAGDESVQGLRLKDGTIIDAEGLFVLGGETAPERLIPGLEITNNHITVNRQQETNLPGIFAAGDCAGPPYQVAKSVGEGQVAGLNASKYSSRQSGSAGHRV